MFDVHKKYPLTISAKGGNRIVDQDIISSLDIIYPKTAHFCTSSTN